MIEVFNAISNIAISIEENVFTNYGKFTQGDKNDQQVENDVYKFCSSIIEKECESIKSVKSVISKDKKQMCEINSDGKYIITYVAIDTITLLDVDFSLGSIFGIYENSLDADSLKATVYVTYGPTFQIVFASKSEGVKYFSFEHGEFVQKDSLSLKEKGKINSPAGGFHEYSSELKALAQNFFDEGYRLRFSNSLCLDTHQILFKQGGVYLSPVTPSNPNGSLEVIFEAWPIAFVIELAGGKATTGIQRVLSLSDVQLHDTTPMFFGSNSEIEKVEEFFQK